MGAWIRKTIGELCDLGNGEVKTGPFGSQLHQSDYSDEGTPVVMPADIQGDGISEYRIARVSDAHVDRLAKHKLSKGDIIYGRRGDIGRQALVREKNVGWLCGTGCLRITLGDSEVLPEFLHLYLKMPEIVGWIQNQAIGATMPNLNTQILRRVPVFYPESKDEQENIIGFTFAYDDLIENNKRRITLLEKMAEEIYREWFVRFRFPGYQTAEFEKGIPKDWDIKKLGDILELSYGKALKVEDRVEGEVPVYGSSGVVGYHDRPLVKRAGIIVGRKGNVGSVFWSEKPFFPIDTVYFVESGLSNYFLYYLLQSMNFINNDAAVPGLNRNQAYSNELLLPEENLIQKFEEVVQPIFEQARLLHMSNDSLQRTKDMLLPRLISGKLSVADLDIQFPPSMSEDEAA